MGLILDTSAVIGWLERRNPETARVIEDAGTVPEVHIVTLGELHEGVERARSGRAVEVLRSRVATLTFVLDELGVAAAPDRDEATVFGVVSADVGRGLSHNDKWILSRAILDSSVLVTEDERLFDAASSDSLGESVQTLGLVVPPVRLLGGAR